MRKTGSGRRRDVHGISRISPSYWARHGIEMWRGAAARPSMPTGWARRPTGGTRRDRKG